MMRKREAGTVLENRRFPAKTGELESLVTVKLRKDLYVRAVYSTLRTSKAELNPRERERERERDAS